MKSIIVHIFHGPQRKYKNSMTSAKKKRISLRFDEFGRLECNFTFGYNMEDDEVATKAVTPYLQITDSGRTYYYGKKSNSSSMIYKTLVTVRFYVFGNK